VLETLHLTVNIIDQFLATVMITRQRLQLLGVTGDSIPNHHEVRGGISTRNLRSCVHLRRVVHQGVTVKLTKTPGSYDVLKKAPTSKFELIYYDIVLSALRTTLKIHRQIANLLQL
jgi:hypothetical protein